MTPPRHPPELNSGVLPGNVHADDWVMLALAVLSVGLLGFMLLSLPPYRVGIWIFSVDCAVCAVFLLDFVRRWRKRRWERRFLARSWYELFAMLPVAHPALMTYRFVAVVLLLVRIGRGVDRAVGEQFVYRLVDKLSEPIVLAIKRPITLAVLDEVIEVLKTGHYPDNLAKSLTASRSELLLVISEKVAEDPQLGRLKRIPYYDEITRGTVDMVFRVLLEVLRDPRIDEFFASVVRDNQEQIRRAVALGHHDAPPSDRVSDREQPPWERPERAAPREDQLRTDSRW